MIVRDFHFAGPKLLRLLRDLGHEVVPVAEVGLSRARDAEIMEAARRKGGVFITRDRGFGSYVVADEGDR